MSLQTFLQLSGYLSATPNGYFGPATLAAVKKFQTATGITSTGYVGPVTRLAVQVKSCEPVKMEPIATTPTAPAQANTASVPVKFSITVTSPWTDETLTLGKLHTIRWAGKMTTNDSLVLEDQYGTSKGYVAYFPGDNGEYVWDVGRVQVGNDIETVPSGKYRIRAYDKLKGVTISDPKGGLFSIIPPTLALNSAYPSSVKADGKSSVALLGSGFAAGTRVYLGGSYENMASVLFVSPDGAILVFSVPNTVATGDYRVTLRNEYGSVSSNISVTVK
jgi:hypothetical protein